MPATALAFALAAAVVHALWNLLLARAPDVEAATVVALLTAVLVPVVIGASWYDADHLLVVNQAASGPQLEVVPVDGDRSSYQGTEPGMTSIAAAGPRNSLFAGLQTGQLARSLGLSELWNQFAPGRAATTTTATPAGRSPGARRFRSSIITKQPPKTAERL